MEYVEPYNPAIHCCPRWHKDFCDCVKADMKQFKKDRRDRNVCAVINALDKKKIEWEDSNTQNVIQIAIPNKPLIYLSLKTTTNRYGFTIYKFRMQGSKVWHTSKRDKFIARVKELQSLNISSENGN